MVNADGLGRRRSNRRALVNADWLGRRRLLGVADGVQSA
jgi:hypothetical protein